MLACAALGLLVVVVIALPSWAVSVAKHDASLADRVWPVFIAAPAVLYVAALGGGLRAQVMLAITLAWALRLGLHITWRNRGHGEDRRYRAMRERNQPNFALKSLWLVFLLQAALGWVVGWPLLAAAGSAASSWSAWDTLGAAIAVAGLLIEALADAQLARFKRDPAHHGQVMDRGLWAWSRHPNYFGEACVWWGLAVMACAGGGWAGAWCLASPLLMTVLLLRVSGVSLLEQNITERRPAYRDYIARTSAFLPWPPRRGAAR